jgi:hypothetical protein
MTEQSETTLDVERSMLDVRRSFFEFLFLSNWLFRGQRLG